MNSKKLNLASLLILSTLLVTSQQTAAQAGTLDPTFGTGGIFTTSFNSGDFGTIANVVAIQSDGKILIGGSTPAGTAVLRLNTNGTLDTTFGAGGIATFDNQSDGVFAMAIQPDGKILAATEGFFTGRIGRLNTNGSLDTSFGTGGIATPSSLISQTAAPNALALQSNGEILLTGSGLMGRLTSTGQLDTSFGTGGLVPLASQIVTAIALQSNGKILVTTGSGAPNFIQFALGLPSAQAGSIARYNTNGSLDKTFGASGQAACVASAAGIAIQSDEKIVVAGTITSALLTTTRNGIIISGNQTGFGLVRYNPNGSIDTTFNKGIALTGFGSLFPVGGGFSLAIQSNGEILVAGQAGVGNNNGTGSVFVSSSFVLARFTSAGQLDTTFGTKGTVFTPIGSGNISFVSALALQSDGKIIAAGNFGPPPPVGEVVRNSMAIARYLAQ